MQHQVLKGVSALPASVFVQRHEPGRLKHNAIAVNLLLAMTHQGHLTPSRQPFATIRSQIFRNIA